MTILCECGGKLDFVKHENGRKNDIDEQDVEIGFDMGRDEDIMDFENEKYANVENIKFFIHCKKCDTILELC